MSAFEDLFREIDARWALGAQSILIIGSTALMAQTRYRRGTKDSDILETLDLPLDRQRHLAEVAGRGTDVHRRHGLYVEVVANGIPFLPRPPRWRELEALNAQLRHLRVQVLDVVDVVVSKLKRLNANDLADIDAMAGLGLVPHAELLERFRTAVDGFAGDARAEDLPRYVRNLHRIERDLLGAAETEIELPDWI